MGVVIKPKWDGRSSAAKRYHRVLNELSNQHRCVLDPTKMVLVGRAAVLTIWCEDEEEKFLTGAPYDVAQLTTSTNTLHRLLDDLRDRERK